MVFSGVVLFSSFVISAFSSSIDDPNFVGMDSWVRWIVESGYVPLNLLSIGSPARLAFYILSGEC